MPIHIEVLLPAFVLGSIMAYPGRGASGVVHESDAHSEIETPAERRVSTLVAAIFMVLVGPSMPKILGADLVKQGGAMAESVEPTLHAAGPPAAEAAAAELERERQVGRVTAAQPPITWPELAFQVLIIAILSNLGKMFPAFCYRREAHWRERLAVAIGMWPRGEVGAGVLGIPLSYGIGGPHRNDRDAQSCTPPPVDWRIHLHREAIDSLVAGVRRIVRVRERGLTGR